MSTGARPVGRSETKLQQSGVSENAGVTFCPRPAHSGAAPPAPVRILKSPRVSAVLSPGNEHVLLGGGFLLADVFADFLVELRPCLPRPVFREFGAMRAGESTEFLVPVFKFDRLKARGRTPFGPA